MFRVCFHTHTCASPSVKCTGCCRLLSPNVGTSFPGRKHITVASGEVVSQQERHPGPERGPSSAVPPASSLPQEPQQLPAAYDPGRCLPPSDLFPRGLLSGLRMWARGMGEKQQRYLTGSFTNNKIIYLKKDTYLMP